ncbi:Uu.00g032460.m01.CDS01 [Anthostomella pinea]|uniref:Uu.00g032460.m01.CDS01 n=1 Tax=Anthostomella pinea TaxID=933095 RepID=A0AAI8V3T2_9PEZI|nr:Uu.00g032460.m01.CDS01 [Anthostomella pinea]
MYLIARCSLRYISRLIDADDVVTTSAAIRQTVRSSPSRNFPLKSLPRTVAKLTLKTKRIMHIRCDGWRTSIVEQLMKWHYRSLDGHLRQRKEAKKRKRDDKDSTKKKKKMRRLMRKLKKLEADSSSDDDSSSSDA